MKTTKPISTISYNSWSFLVGTLERLSKEGWLRFWAFIEHMPEEDEKKSHFHVYCMPAKQLDVQWFEKQFLELDPDNPKPLKTLPFDLNSKWVDWYWYGLHDEAYLMSKRQVRKHHYQPYEVRSSDEDYLDELVRRNPNPKADVLKVLDLMKQGLSDFDIATSLNVPVRNLMYFLHGLGAVRTQLRSNRTYRADRVPHDEYGVIENDNEED